MNREESDDAVRRLVFVWYSLSGYQRRWINESVSRELYKALHALVSVDFDAETEADEPDEVVEADPVNRAPSITGSPDCGGYPAEQRVADLEKFMDARHVRETARHVRETALHHARKIYLVNPHSNPHDRAEGVLVIARAFEQYLTGTAPTATEVATLESGSEAGRAAIFSAAMTWVEVAHLRNRSGLENWRNWADDHDILLINAVLTYRGMAPLEQEKP